MKLHLKLLTIFFSALISVRAFGNELELFFYRAPAPINWDSPGKLVRSMMRNQRMEIDGEKYPHPISHVNIRLQCDSTPSAFFGMTSTKSDRSYLWDLLVKGSSLDIMLINQKGRTYTKNEIVRWLPRLQNHGYVRSLKILLNHDQCERAQRYLTLYSQTGLVNIYGGLRSDPLRGEGAGCSAFAVSILRVLNLLPTSVSEKWQRELKIPLELLSNWENRSRISFLSFLFGKDRSWARPGEAQIHLKFWDPELMYEWANKPLTIWDARSEKVPQHPFFALERNTFLNTVRYHYQNRQRLLSKEEILDPPSGICRNFRPCK
ncbi:MAG: hypothetical protein ACXVCY_12150 [Pseudobdellovibrionaceae bacterium]